MTWKVVNRHGQKPPPASWHISQRLTRSAADVYAAHLDARGFDDGPFTVQPWGQSRGWYSEEGHREAAIERGEDPDA